MRPRAATLIVAVLTALGLVTAPAAMAATGGTVDRENKYSNVANILYYAEDGGRYRCTATLVSSTVLLTAAHCTDGTVGSTLVDFDPIIAEAPPLPYPTAADPAAGYTEAEITGADYVSGTADTHPEYSDFTDMDNWNDVGVIKLDEAYTAAAPAPIADLGTLDEISKSNLSKTLFRAVGYGTEVRKPESGPQKPTPFTYPLVRRYVDMPGQKLTPQILQTNGNPNDNKGTGGTCFGDSGGPVFYKDQIVAVTSYGYTENCRYLGGYQRVDIPVVQDWLAGVDVGLKF